jgi:hypothetical protein
MWLVSYVALWVMFAIMAVVIIGMLRLIGSLYSTVETLKRDQGPLTNLVSGKEVPEVEMQTLDGTTTTIGQFAGKNTAFVIVSSDCTHCQEILAHMVGNGFHTRHDLPRIVIMSLSDIPQAIDLATKFDLGDAYPVLADVKGQVKNRWGIKATPVTVLVDEAMRVYRQLFGPMLLTPELAAPQMSAVMNNEH